MKVNKLVNINGEITTIVEEMPDDDAMSMDRELLQLNAERELDNAYKLELLLASIPVQEKPANRPGYFWKPVYRNDGSGFGWEEVADPYYVPTADGSYISPLPYIAGMDVVAGKFYTDGDDVWEAVESGRPASFIDAAFFDVIIY